MGLQKTLSAARSQGNLVAFAYIAGDGEMRTRYGVVDKVTETYVTIYDLIKEGWRTARLDRIKGPVLTFNRRAGE